MKLPKNIRKSLFATNPPQRPVVAMQAGIGQPVTLQPSPRHVVDPSAAPGRGLAPGRVA